MSFLKKTHKARGVMDVEPLCVEASTTIRQLAHQLPKNSIPDAPLPNGNESRSGRPCFPPLTCREPFHAGSALIITSALCGVSLSYTTNRRSTP